MFGDFMKRLWNGGILLLAAVTFFLIPVGRKTPAEHMTAIFRSPPAREAAAAFAGAARRITARASAEFKALREGDGDKPRFKGEGAR